MKILILGHYEIASNYAISQVVELLNGVHDISIMLSGRGDVFEKKSQNLDPNSFAALAQHEQKLCDELNSGNDLLDLKCCSFNELEKVTGKVIEILAEPNSQMGLEIVGSYQPDLVVSIRYRKILKEDFIKIPAKGIINLHSGLLPDYRGAMASFWSMLNQEKDIGTTLHFISDGSIDTGEIIYRSAQECDYQKSYLKNVLSLYPQGAMDIVQAVEIINENLVLQSRSQESLGAYYSFPNEEHRQEFIVLGSSLF